MQHMLLILVAASTSSAIKFPCGPSFTPCETKAFGQRNLKGWFGNICCIDCKLLIFSIYFAAHFMQITQVDQLAILILAWNKGHFQWSGWSTVKAVLTQHRNWLLSTSNSISLQLSVIWHIELELQTWNEYLVSSSNRMACLDRVRRWCCVKGWPFSRYRPYEGPYL